MLWQSPTCRDKQSDGRCFVDTCLELLRTEFDFLRVVRAVHNITAAYYFNGNTRHRVWTELNGIWRKNKWPLRAFMKDEQLLRDNGITNTKKKITRKRNRVLQTNRLPITREQIHDRLKNRPDAQQSRWTEELLWLALASGSRRIELLRTSTFAAVPSWPRYIQQTGLAKKKDGLDSHSLLKPLLGTITATDFLATLASMRGKLEPLIDRKFSKQQRPTREALGTWAKSPIRCELRRQWQSLVPKFHLLRAIYGNMSYLQYAQEHMSLTVWLSRVLGHDQGDLGTAMHYQTVYIK